jgi:mannose-6-phosphate isomerase-like protein (cupin superfamily)
MQIHNRNTSPRYTRNGIESFLLIPGRECCADNLSVTLVEVTPGGAQELHRHEQEQSYYILTGNGLMTVGEEQREVSAGDCVFIGSNEYHGLLNTGTEELRYISSTSPSFTPEQADSLWPLSCYSEIWKD